MRLPDEISDFLQPLYPFLPQILPLSVVLICPLLVISLANSTSIAWQISMVFESLGSLFNWSSSRDSSASSESADKKKLRKKLIRTRTEQIASLNGDAATYPPIAKPKERSGDGYYPGLVNLSGTYCFMNSTLQALASLSYLQPQIDDIHARAVAINVATPVIDPLRDILHVLNTPRSYPKAERPIELIQALSTDPSGRKNPLLCSRDHQDAQELFQLLSESIKREATAVDKECLRDRGLGGISRPVWTSRRKDVGKTVFDGLTANRRSCVVCGYTEAVMHFAFNNWQLAVPHTSACNLTNCLSEYTRLEKLTDCICRKCSMLATYQKLLHESERQNALMSVDPNPSSHKRKRARDARDLEMRVKAALDEGRIEDDIPGVKLEKVISPESTKQAMIARPPPVLALHLNRSMHHGYHATKNSCRVEFPEILDLTAFTTSGQLSTVPNIPISSPSQVSNRSLTPTPPNCNPPRTYYQLSAVVCHFGQHSFGHYISYRRKPRPPSAGSSRFSPPKLACPWRCECDRCQKYGPVRVDDGYDMRRKIGHGWLRISDDSVQECGIETVLQEGSAAFMLFYEKVLQPRPSAHLVSQTPRGSEETVRPRDVQESGSGAPVEAERARRGEIVRPASAQGKLLRPRIVRSVSAPRHSRGPSGNSVPPPHSERGLPISPSVGNGNVKAHRNGHAPNGSARPTPTAVGSTSTSWYHQPTQIDSRSVPSAVPHTSKDAIHQRSYQPSNSLQRQSQHITT